ncbi:MAG: hypothetical protein AAFV93_13565 [Chloroflexota bacterium]
MFNGLLAKLTADDNPRLHRTPFMLIWIAAYGLAWIAVSGLTNSLLYDLIYDLVSWYTYAGIISMVYGLAFGGTLSLTQGWILRRRYGFVPRFWRIGTILGMVIATGAFFFIIYYSYSDNFWLAGSAWVILFAVFQTAILFRVNRHAWYFIPLSILLVFIGLTIDLLNFPNSRNDFILIILIGCSIQAFGTAIITMHLMANPREGIVPKRDDSSKAKNHPHQKMSSIAFVGLWIAGLATGWGFYFLIMLIWYATVDGTNVADSTYTWIDSIMPWFAGAFMGAMSGLVAGVAQTWLMKQYSNTQIRYWGIVTVIGCSLAGIGLWEIIDSRRFGWSLIAWVSLPLLLQTILMWRTMRGGWVWGFAGITSAIITHAVYTQFDLKWMYDGDIYVIVFGTVLSAIISGATFVLLQAQHRPPSNSSPKIG